MKKQSCRMTAQEIENHKEAGKYRRMTDQQLVDTIRNLQRRAEKAEASEKALAALATDAQHEVEKAREECKSSSCSADAANEKAAVEKFILHLQSMAGTGNGIGNGTIFKLRRILADMP